MSDGQGIGCICRNFADERFEFISAYEMAGSVKKKNEMSEYEHFIYVCKLNGLKEEDVRNFLEYQILSDFVLTNTDRHFNNFGVLRNSETLKLVGMAPIFDSGNSMFWNNPNLSKTSDLLDIPVSSFRKKEVDLLRYIKNVHLVETGNLPSEEEVRKLIEYDRDYQNKIEGILEGYQKKINLLEQLQKGEKIWRRWVNY